MAGAPPRSEAKEHPRLFIRYPVEMRMEKAMKSMIIAATASVLVTAPLMAQEDNTLVPIQPVKSQDQVPGVQQTPDGQTMKTAGERMKPVHEALAGSVISTSTGPTFPDAMPAK
jgi:hypothetical protein